ncbi:unnamed protein product [Acanthoscelides obtectus]|uniref:Uncharacterized protein n=1 Tax=Acanthoscelides obtectus TaxID=200917 RepID=A0A9P0QAI6_ACAOB|nr:unnamed protein product [Acanthoscelides obtectus]CAK1623603.1 hypothetical protein AOBTE_LOCUS2091 [Acanthoscelides obtectus]
MMVEQIGMVNGEKSSKMTPIGRVGANISASATMALRDKLAEYLISDAGAVSWQMAYVNRGRF